MSKNIRGHLTDGLRTLAQNKIEMKLDDQGLIVCSLVEQTINCTHAVEVTMYLVGYLAFYGLILGKEGMFGKWCHLCQLSGREFTDLVKFGDDWTNKEMKRSVKEYHEKIEEHKRKKTKTYPKPTKGTKEQPWWA